MTRGSLALSQPTTHRNATPPPTMSLATLPTLPLLTSLLPFFPLQLGTQDYLFMEGDIMGTSTTTLSCHLPGNVACHYQSSCLPRLDESSFDGVFPSSPLDSQLKRKGWRMPPHTATIYCGPWRLPALEEGQLVSSGPFPLGAAPSPQNQNLERDSLACVAHGRPGHMRRSRRALCPEDPTGAKESQHGQAGTCFPRRESDIQRVGQHLPDFP